MKIGRGVCGGRIEVVDDFDVAKVLEEPVL